MAKDKSITRNIPQNTQNYLWGVSAGRCQFCGKKLFVEGETNAVMNIAQKAHIEAYSKGGPRYNESKENPHNLDNLMLLCMEHHKMIDDFPEIYTVEKLTDIKEKFEEKVSAIVELMPVRSSILKFNFPITKDGYCKIEKSELYPVLIDNGYFSDGKYYEISYEIPGLDFSDIYYSVARTTISKQIQEKISLIRESEVLSVFGIGPQPLLVYLGYLLSDETNIKVYQRFRTGDLKWNWKSKKQTNEFSVESIEDCNDNSKEITEVNVVISISAEIDLERINNTESFPTVVIKSKNSHMMQ